MKIKRCKQSQYCKVDIVSYLFNTGILRNGTHGLNSTLFAEGYFHLHSEDVFHASGNLECQPETCSDIVGPTRSLKKVWGLKFFLKK